MKVKVTLSSDDGIQWDAESKDIGLVTSGASMMSALERMEEEIQKFFANSFGSNKRLEVVCSKIKATASVTVSPVDPRPETPLTNFVPEEPFLLEGQDLIEGKEYLALPAGEESDEIELEDPDTPDPSGTIIDADFTPVQPASGVVGE
jgi:hypothetical protein